jgi:mono/diheme cytochrome c family protein
MLTKTLTATALLIAMLSASAADLAQAADAQTDKGQRLYQQNCAVCHGVKLEGNVGPALAGKRFLERSVEEGRTADDLFFIVRTFMPMGQPGKLSKQEYVDVVAYLLQANGIAAGAKNLTAASKQLGAITISALDR